MNQITPSQARFLEVSDWLADRQADLLSVPYFHVVFTVLAEVTVMAFQNKAVIYAILFQAAADDRRRPTTSGGRDWVHRHPAHMGADANPPPACPLRRARRRIIARRRALDRLPPGFFLPIQVLSRLYRRLFLERLHAAFDAGRLRFFGDLARLAEARAFTMQIKRVRQITWVVYAKPSFGSPDQVLAYLGRYTIAWRSPTAGSWPWTRPGSGSADTTIGRRTRTS